MSPSISRSSTGISPPISNSVSASCRCQRDKSVSSTPRSRSSTFACDISMLSHSFIRRELGQHINLAMTAGRPWRPFTGGASTAPPGMQFESVLVPDYYVQLHERIGRGAALAAVPPQLLHHPLLRDPSRAPFPEHGPQGRPARSLGLYRLSMRLSAPSRAVPATGRNRQVVFTVARVRRTISFSIPSSPCCRSPMRSDTGIGMLAECPGDFPWPASGTLDRGVECRPHDPPVAGAGHRSRWLLSAGRPAHGASNDRAFWAMLRLPCAGQRAEWQGRGADRRDQRDIRPGTGGADVAQGSGRSHRRPVRPKFRHGQPGARWFRDRE